MHPLRRVTESDDSEYSMFDVLRGLFPIFVMKDMAEPNLLILELFLVTLGL